MNLHNMRIALSKSQLQGVCTGLQATAWVGAGVGGPGLLGQGLDATDKHCTGSASGQNSSLLR